MRTIGLALTMIGALLAVSSCGEQGQSEREVVVYSSVDQVFAAPVLKQFETDTKIRVRAVLRRGSVWCAS